MRTTFNAVTVDGDRSTNDTLLLFATGQAGAPRIAGAGDARLADFRDKLEGVLLDLAQQLVRDGEGATKFVKITVTGARSGRLGPQDRPHHRREPAGQDRLRRRGRQLGPHRHGRRPRRRAGQPRAHERQVRRRSGPPRTAASSPDYSEAKMSAYMKKKELEVARRRRRRPRLGGHVDLRPDQGYVEINGDYRS